MTHQKNQFTRLLRIERTFLEAVLLCSHPKGSQMSRVQAAKYMKKLKVTKGLNRYLEAKHVDDLPKRGKTRKTSSAEDKRISHIFFFY